MNGFTIGAIGAFTLRDKALFASPAELGNLGFRVPEPVVPGADGLIGLSQLPGLTWRLDEANQAIYVTTPNELRVPARLTPGGAAADMVRIESGTGVTLNYDVSADMAEGVKTVSGLFHLRGFSPRGVVNSGIYVRSGSGDAWTAGTAVVRLDTTAQFSDVATLRRYTVGDFVTAGLGWTRPVRMGGGQIRSDFSMRPDLVTFPLPTVRGAAAVPSTVDVFANGVRLFSDSVAPGPFEIPQLPVVSGDGNISVTLTDALGRQTTSTMPFYASPDLLKPGLQTYAAQLGYVRRSWGVLSNDYADLAASAAWRRGLTPTLTVEATAEGSADMYMAGAGAVVNVFNRAIVNGAVSFSQGYGRPGWQTSLGVQYVGPVFSYGGAAIVAHSDYLDLAGTNGSPPPTLQLTGNLGISLGAYGAFGLAYARIDRSPYAAGAADDGQPDSARGYLPVAGIRNLDTVRPARFLSASHSIQLGNVSVFTTAYNDFADRGGSGVMLNMTMPLGSRSSISTSAGYASAGGSAQVQAQQSAVSVGDWGYQALASRGVTDHEFGQVDYKSRYALYTAGVDRNDGRTTVRVQAQGALSVVNDTFFGSNTIADSFAVVETGLPNVHVLSENRDAGTTNYRGMLVVPDLRAFEVNHLSIDPDDVPVDASIDTATREVRPQDRSGVVVRFPMRFSHGALLKLVDDAGAPIPVGATATLRATGAIAPVGYDGSAYLEDLAAHNEVLVETLDGQRCSVAFDYVAVRGQIPEIGPLHCRNVVP